MTISSDNRCDLVCSPLSSLHFPLFLYFPSLSCNFPHCSSAERAAAPQHSSGPSGLHRRGPWEGAPGHHTGAHLLILFFLLLFLLLQRLCHHVAPHHLLHVHHLLCHPPALHQSPEQPPLHGQPHDGRDLRQAGARGRWGGSGVWERGCWLEITLTSD